MPNLKDLVVDESLGRDVQWRKERVGIELEFEDSSTGRSMPLSVVNLWRIMSDDSLRNGGIEFVSHPISPNEVGRHLKVIDELINSTSRYYTPHKRCGVHVHLNVGDLTYEQLWKILTVYCCVEPWIFAEWEPNRIDNHFCVPMFLSSNLPFLQDSALMYQQKKGRIASSTLRLFRVSKYQALNTSTITNLSTIEFRHLAATKDMKRVESWVEFILELRRVALSYELDDIIPNRHNIRRKLKLTRKSSKDYLNRALYNAYCLGISKPLHHSELDWSI